jgi:energy-coupling factor transporter ATP-binding protein EcfA2
VSEILHIKNFGPIKSVELDLRRVNVLIGDQGTGKSTIAKILDILKNISNQNSGELHLSIGGKHIQDEVEISKYKNEHFKTDFFNRLEGSDIKNYLTEHSYIFFENNSCKVVIDKFEILFIDKKRSKEKNTNLNYYIPAFREAYILLRNNYPAILNAKANLPAILNTFGQHFNNYREDLKYFNFKDIIGVDYVYNGIREFILLQDGTEISFEESSSAVSSVVPMLVVFLGIVHHMSEESPRVFHYDNCPFITIEEPELNCYPETQKKLVEFLIEKIRVKNSQKSKEYYCNLLLTTHSPYILTTLNNLMYAYNLGEINFDDTSNVIPEKKWLNPIDVSAYILKTDGTCENIMDEELKQIKVEKIDEISEVLSTQWHQLADLNFAK